jgi:hypothetical protein
MNKSSGERYIHRKNADRSYDSICLQCFRTVATSSDELALAELENLHKCSGWAMYANAIVESPSWRRGHYAL